MLPNLSKSQFYSGKIVTLTSLSSPEPLKVKIIRRLVESKTADVFSANYELPNKNILIALKRFKGETGKKLGQREKTTLEKIQNVKSLENNEKICHLLGFYSENNSEEEYSYTIALEFCGTTLHEIMKKKKFNMFEIKTFAEDMILIFSHFQKIGLFYRDMKPGNIFYNRNTGTIEKIIDFDVSVWLDEISAEKDNSYMLSLAGTPKYMAPELYAIYMKLRKAKHDGELEEETKALIASNINDQMAVSQNKVEDFDDERTLKITKKEFKIDEDLETNSKVSASECFKMDVFSLGLIILEMALSFTNPFQKEVKIQEINRNQKNLEDAFIEFNRFKKDKVFQYLRELLDKMLVWEQNDRWDFIELEDYLLYEKSLDLTNKYNYMEIEQKFTSISTFRDIWDTKDMNHVQNHFFSIGYLAKFIDKEYIKTLLVTSSDPHCLNNLTKEVQTIHFTCLTGNLIEGLVKIYTMDEGGFYQELNKCLGKNKVDKYKYYLTSFLKFKNQLVAPISSKVLHRVILLNGDPKWKYEARNQYFPGMNYYWPSFTSCTMSLEVAEEWIRKRLALSENSNVVLFVVTINNENISNKLNISKFSKFPSEQEVLLLPYFSFKVTRNQPFKKDINGLSRTISIIEVEEIDRKIFKFWILWINDDEEYSRSQIVLAREIQKKFGDVLKKFDKTEDAVNFLKIHKLVSIIIYSGKDIETALEKIKGFDLVAKVLHFDEKKNYQENVPQNYERISGIYDLLQALPDSDIFY